MFRNISLSLADITGSEYIRGLVDSCDFFGTLSREEAERLAYEKIDFYPESAQKRNDELARLVGELPPTPSDTLKIAVPLRLERTGATVSARTEGFILSEKASITTHPWGIPLRVTVLLTMQDSLESRMPPTTIREDTSLACARSRSFSMQTE